jgi:hypothetical protein
LFSALWKSNSSQNGTHKAIIFQQIHQLMTDLGTRGHVQIFIKGCHYKRFCPYSAALRNSTARYIHLRQEQLAAKDFTVVNDNATSAA